MAKITPLSLHVINEVKFRRLFLGYSAERLSRLIKRSHGYILTVENSNLESQYPAHEWPLLAEALECEIHDLLPFDEMNPQSTGKLVNKIVLSLDREEDVKLIVDELVVFGFFKEGKTLAEIAKHLVIDEQQQLKLLSAVLNNCTNSSLPLRKAENGLFISEPNQ